MEPNSDDTSEDNPALVVPQVGSDEELFETLRRGSFDFDSWTSVLSEIEQSFPDNIEMISVAYDSFLSDFPLFYGYWRKYAAHVARLSTVDKVIEIFERAVQSSPYSVGIWIEYCSFSVSAFEDPCDVRRLFRRAMSFVGKDFLCHPLWDKFIKFELSHEQWSSLAHIYIETLKFPTRKLHRYYDSFRKFAAMLEEEVQNHNHCIVESRPESVTDSDITTLKEEISLVIADLLNSSAVSSWSKTLQKYISIGDHFYQEACELEKKILCFETCIRRSFFHVLPLEDSQLKNWHRYLDFIETQEDFDWAVRIYERCLIPCANYPEFWMRYIQFVETKGGREIAKFALDRATNTFLKNSTEMHFFCAQYKEQIRDICGARKPFLQHDNECSSYFIDRVVKEANMEKRLGNFAAASNVYEKALKIAAESQLMPKVPLLYIHFSRLKHAITGSVDAALDVLLQGIRQVPHSKLLLEGLINFSMTSGGQGHLNVVGSVISTAIIPRPKSPDGLSDKEREDISALYLELVDQHGTILDIRQAYNRHIKLFPHSLRTISQEKLHTSCTQLLDMLAEGRQRNSNQSTQVELANLSLPFSLENHIDMDPQNQLQEENGGKNTEIGLDFSPKVAETLMEDDPPLSIDPTQLVHEESVQDPVNQSLGHSESFLVRQSESSESEKNLKQPTGEDNMETGHSEKNTSAPTELLKSLSLDGPSNSQEIGNSNHIQEILQKNSEDDNIDTSHLITADSVLIRKEFEENELKNSPSSEHSQIYPHCSINSQPPQAAQIGQDENQSQTVSARNDQQATDSQYTMQSNVPSGQSGPYDQMYNQTAGNYFMNQQQQMMMMMQQQYQQGLYFQQQQQLAQMYYQNLPQMNDQQTQIMQQQQMMYYQQHYQQQYMQIQQQQQQQYGYQQGYPQSHLEAQQEGYLQAQLEAHQQGYPQSQNQIDTSQAQAQAQAWNYGYYMQQGQGVIPEHSMTITTTATGSVESPMSQEKSPQAVART